MRKVEANRSSLGDEFCDQTIRFEQNRIEENQKYKELLQKICAVVTEIELLAYERGDKGQPH